MQPLAIVDDFERLLVRSERPLCVDVRFRPLLYGWGTDVSAFVLVVGRVMNDFETVPYAVPREPRIELHRGQQGENHHRAECDNPEAGSDLSERLEAHQRDAQCDDKYVEHRPAPNAFQKPV